jgi:ribosomal protein S18 acetylase RimI-like enzyme
MTHLLDNPAWNALISNNQHLSSGKGKAKYFQREVSPFAGMAQYTRAGFKSLYESIPDEKPVGLFTDIKDLDTAPWKLINRIDGYQMLYNKEISLRENGLKITPLQSQDVPQMLALTGLTKPGPFLVRTIEFGGYEGIWAENQLLAMAGRRFHSGTYVEISAVCTHPDHVGKGYARQLILNQIRHIQSAGNIPYLHVRADNSRAVEIYQKMGFTTRKQMYIHILSKD